MRLPTGDRTALPRQQSLRALIDWSHDLLTDPERVLLRRLSVFAGGWTLEAAEAVCAGGDIDEADVLDLLTHLVDKSLVAMAILVTAADFRMGKMGSMVEQFYGDGAGCLVLGKDNVVAEFKGSFSVSYDFVDHFRGDRKPFDRTWEERWIRDDGYLALMPRAIEAALGSIAARDVDYLLVRGPQRFAAAVAKAVGIRAEAVPADLHVDADVCARAGSTIERHFSVEQLPRLQEAGAQDGSDGSTCDCSSRCSTNGRQSMGH